MPANAVVCTQLRYDDRAGAEALEQLLVVHGEIWNGRFADQAEKHNIWIQQHMH